MKRKLLSTISVLMALALSGCGLGSERDLARISPDPGSEAGYSTAYVLRGDVTYELKEELQLDNYTETRYGFSSKDIDSTLLEDIKFDELYVNVGDMVKEGDVLLTLSSESLENEIDSYTEQKDLAVLEKTHYENRTMIDSDEDNETAINNCDEQISIANGYLTELYAKKELLTIRADQDGKVISISDQALSGKVSGSDSLLTIASGDDTYFLETDKITTLEVGQIVEADNGVVKYDALVTGVEKSATGSKVYFKLGEPGSELTLDMATGTDATETDASMTGASQDGELIIVYELMVTVAEETREDVLYVSADCVKEIDDKYYVFMLNDNGVRYAQEVEIDAILGDKAIIKSGLEEGDEVIAGNY